MIIDLILGQGTLNLTEYKILSELYQHKMQKMYKESKVLSEVYHAT